MKPILLCTLILFAIVTTPAQTTSTPADLHRMADDYYRWRNQNYPVASSDMGLHTWDNRLTDYSLSAILASRLYVRDLLNKVEAMQTKSWSKDDRIDWLLFRSQLDGVAFFNRVMDSEATDPQTYVNECSNAIFSLLKKEYDAPRVRGIAATARLKQMPFLIEQGKGNLTKPVQLYAQLAIDSARSIDSLFNDSLMTLTKDMSPAEKAELMKARDAALVSIHGFADWLEKRLPGMVPFKPMGEENYNYLLKNIYLLPLMQSKSKCWARQNSRVIARLNRCCRIHRWPIRIPRGARISRRIRQDFLQSLRKPRSGNDRLSETNHLVTLPPYLGRFEIRQLPEAFKPTSPGGFMNPPGVYDKDDSGFYFIPTYNPQSQELLHSRSYRRPATDPWSRRNSRSLSATLDREPFDGRDSSPTRRWHLRRRLGALRRRDADAHRTLSKQLSVAGSGTASVALSRRAHRRGRQSAHRTLDLRAGGQLFHGSGRPGSRSG